MHDNELGDALTLAVAMLAFELDEETRERYIRVLRKTMSEVNRSSARKAAILGRIASLLEDGPAAPTGSAPPWMGGGND